MLCFNPPRLQQSVCICFKNTRRVQQDSNTHRHTVTQRGRAHSTSASQAYIHPPPPSQVQEDKQRADRVLLQRIEPDSKHPFSVFLFHPLLSFSIFFITLLLVKMPSSVVMFSFTCFKLTVFLFTHTQEHIKAPIQTAPLRPDGALSTQLKKGDNRPIGSR